MPELEPTKALVELLADVDARKVTTNPGDCSAQLELPGEAPANVSGSIWAMEKADWVREPARSVVWELTDAGREVLEEGVPGDLIDEGEGLLT